MRRFGRTQRRPAVQHPDGRTGRPSKALTVGQARALLAHEVTSTYGAYVVLGLPTGARTEELRALVWTDVDLIGDPDAGMTVDQIARLVGHTAAAR